MTFFFKLKISFSGYYALTGMGVLHEICQKVKGRLFKGISTQWRNYYGKLVDIYGIKSKYLLIYES